ncbi:hypothetical protein M041_gp20 [Mycobacterium phage Severus]|uniref:hypothetical protein n=1 Tax=Mycobacterium phage Severus TaxID=1327776 RepID=UPI00032B41B4|nr:hypothetical protein M041_gp20 [Mycobacterium phage Severus]AGK87999.1 hypothetical protein PBI_SEVERUS_67 [Mycobacterium phage Severus]AVO22466.1 hypothetical protein SEA_KITTENMITTENS_66 [Mycobacterium phage KittenMittens]QZD97051.1 hypothetical protein SEA_DRAKE94_67 [Mycobacterium phage Drake94]USL89197.1 hypothetical protein SEA_POOMPHA_66 [Mycobacterium phage Poompha]
MPLQIVADTLNLPTPVVRADTKNWVFAETMNLFDATLLLVYRSVALRETDPIYKDVVALMERHTVEILYEPDNPERGIVRDDSMMFGHGQWEVFLLHEGAPKEVTDPRAKYLVEMLRNWGDALHPAQIPDEVMRRVRPMEEVA